MRKIGILVLTVFSIVSCNSTKITSDYDKTIDFTKYKTLEYYGWEDNSNRILSQFDKDRIESSFGNEFKDRGYSLAEKGKGDIIVSLYIVTEQKQQTTATTTGMSSGYGYGGYYGYGPGWGYGGGMSTTTYSTYDYTVGTLIISVYDAKEQKLIWEATAAGEINDNPQAREKSIPILAKQMMMKYPVKPLE